MTERKAAEMRAKIQKSAFEAQSPGAARYLRVVHAAPLNKIRPRAKASCPAPDDRSAQRVVAANCGERCGELVEHCAAERIFGLGFVELEEGDSRLGSVQGAHGCLAGEFADEGCGAEKDTTETGKHLQSTALLSLRAFILFARLLPAATGGSSPPPSAN